MGTIDYFAIISIAFIGSFGHCVGMCGGIVLAYSSTKLESSWTKYYQTFAHLLYSLGRVTTYVFIGALFGFLGNTFAFSNLSNGILLILVGLVMLLIGISLGGKIKLLSFIEHSIQNSKWYHQYFQYLLRSNSLKSFYMLGLLNGLLPCGLVYFFAVTAAGSASFVDGALIMLFFGLSTIPVVFSLGYFIGFFKQNALRKSFIQLASIGVIFYSFYMMYNGYNTMITPNTDPSCHVTVK